MARGNEKEYDDIKSGVNGVLSDVPAPSGEVITETTEELPETNYDETIYATPEYAAAPQGYSSPAIDMDRIHEIIEAIVNERWEELIGKIGNLVAWKEKVNNDIVSIKQELIRMQENFRDLQNAVLGRVREYDEGIRGVHTEMKALEKVFEKILEPLTTNIKDLNKVTQELKKVKH